MFDSSIKKTEIKELVFYSLMYKLVVTELKHHSNKRNLTRHSPNFGLALLEEVEGECEGELYFHGRLGIQVEVERTSHDSVFTVPHHETVSYTFIRYYSITRYTRQ